MILKLMSNENLPDDDAKKAFTIIANVNEVKFHTLGTGERALYVQYDVPNQELPGEEFVLNGNAYLMNDNGKTVQTFWGN